MEELCLMQSVVACPRFLTMMGAGDGTRDIQRDYDRACCVESRRHWDCTEGYQTHQVQHDNVRHNVLLSHNDYTLRCGDVTESDDGCVGMWEIVALR